MWMTLKFNSLFGGALREMVVSNSTVQGRRVAVRGFSLLFYFYSDKIRNVELERFCRTFYVL